MTDIEILNSKLVFIDDHYPTGLACGKMGLCIYLFYLYRWGENDEYLKVADKLLDEIIADMPNNKDISVEKGLAGIGLGLSHLVKEEFLKGDINDVLEEVDSHIFKSIAFLNTDESFFSKPSLLHLIFYFYKRHTEQRSADSKYLYQELIIKMTEMFQNNLPADFFIEQSTFAVQNYQPPILLFVLSKVFELNIYNQRLTKIIEEYIGILLASIPLLHANRLFLLFGLLCIKPYLPVHQKEINAHAGLLRGSIDLDHILNVEFKNQDIFIKDGLAFVYILLFLIQNYFPEYGIAFNPQVFFKRIETSEAWNAMIKRDYYLYLHNGLFDGFPGANLVLLHLKKHFLS